MAKSFYLERGTWKNSIFFCKRNTVIQQKEQRFEGLFLDDAKVIVVAYGTMARIAKTAVSRLREKGKKIGLIRPIALWPFPQEAFKDIIVRIKKLNSSSSRCLTAR